jgi:hypothetical protein
MVSWSAKMRMGRHVEGFVTVTTLVPSTYGSVFDSEVVEDGLALGAYQLPTLSEGIIISHFAAFQVLKKEASGNVVAEAFGANVPRAHLRGTAFGACWYFVNQIP